MINCNKFEQTFGYNLSFLVVCWINKKGTKNDALIEDKMLDLQRELWVWAHRDSNPEPTDYESAALTVELWALKGFRY